MGVVVLADFRHPVNRAVEIVFEGAGVALPRGSDRPSRIRLQPVLWITGAFGYMPLIGAPTC